MRRLFYSLSLQTQLILLGIVCLGMMGLGILLLAAPVVFPDGPLRLHDGEPIAGRVIIATVLAGFGCLGLIAGQVHRFIRPIEQLRDGLTHVIAGDLQAALPDPMPNRDLESLRLTFDRMVRQLREARDAQAASEQVLAERTRTVDRLLDFSQTIQGAGHPDQVCQTLSHYLRTELELAGVIILARDAEVLPAITAKAAWPENVLDPAHPVGEMDAAMCPCLRQSLPRLFKPDGSPVRCAIDACLALPDVAAHPAYCIPFNIGRRFQVLVHMLLPVEQSWTEERRQLAQTYVNTAHSAMMMLNTIREAETQSMTDPLTGLFNRRSMDQLLQREVALADRYNHPLSLVIVDLDKFKDVNDAYGHAAGDHILKAFADAVRITLRKTDLAFRYGGDEFVIALPQTPITQAQQVVQKLRQGFASVDFSHAITRLDQQPTLSIGLAERNKHNNIVTLQNLLAAADEALYQAKGDNRNCVRLYQPHAA